MFQHPELGIQLWFYAAFQFQISRCKSFAIKALGLVIVLRIDLLTDLDTHGCGEFQAPYLVVS